MTLSLITILLVAGGVVAGAVLGWMLHGERRSRTDAVRLERQAEKVQSLEADAARLRRQLDEAQLRLRESADLHHRQLRQVESMREALNEQMIAHQRARQQIHKAAELLSATRHEKRVMNRQLQLLIRRTRAQRAASRAPDTGAQSTANAAGLRAVRGIGPAIERQLKALGIDSLAKLAQLGDADIERIDGQLKFPGRIRRDQWVEQAKALCEDDADT